MAFCALAVLALGVAAIAMFRRFEPARPFPALMALLAVVLAGFQGTEVEAGETAWCPAWPTPRRAVSRGTYRSSTGERYVPTDFRWLIGGRV
ncbi:hypothetical protein ABT083_38010 [Streptomyces goshikiensis]|uniref:hypothetical protein n=1 Tax=Streptomyces goshikiensis TaxID=1942 RepID=UPI0033179D72